MREQDWSWPTVSRHIIIMHPGFALDPSSGFHSVPDNLIHIVSSLETGGVIEIEIEIEMENG